MVINRAVSYQELSYMDCTPVLAQSIHDLLKKGGTFSHEGMVVRRNQANQAFIHPVTKKAMTLPKDAVYAHSPIANSLVGVANSWQVIGKHDNLGDIAVYIADHTPKEQRYALMIDVLDALNEPAPPMSYAPGFTPAF
jgi:hypothetical protein